MAERVRVVDLPAPVASPQLEPVLNELRGSVGLASSLVRVLLVSAEAGVAKTGAAFVCSNTAMDFEDARIDQVRVVGWGSTSVAAHTVRVVDVATGLVLCTATLPTTTAAAFEGAWTMIDTIGGGSRRIRAEAVGNGAATQTVMSLTLECRTVRLVQK
jgi:hypothetical protein